MRTMTLLVAFGSVVSSAWSQEDSPRVLPTGRVNYWGTKEAAPKKPAARTAGAPAVSVWAEPMRLPDGRYATYVPPPQVLEFLDDPTPDGAKRYLAWQTERIAKLRRAMEMLQSIGAPADDESPRPGPDASGPVELLYFKQKDCPFCDLQDAVLVELKKSNPSLAIREIAKSQSPELWRVHVVSVTPTIVVRRGPRAVATFAGLTSLDRIAPALKEVPSEKP